MQTKTRQRHPCHRRHTSTVWLAFAVGFVSMVSAGCGGSPHSAEVNGSTAQLGNAGAASGPTPTQGRSETLVKSASPDADLVMESVVQLYAPLPKSVAKHPEACDWINYLRFRHVNGPTDATRADAVLVGMEGLYGGAALLDQLARHVIKMAAAQGKYVEFWALDRRANCVEDRTGIVAAAAAQDHHIAVDYYYGGREINGRKFEGFKQGSEVPYLADFGFRRTVEDQYEIMRREMPNQADRLKKMFCGGHSLGGQLLAAFVSWDFDGDPKTLEDAGFNQCAGYFALDTTIQGGAGPAAPYVDEVLGPVAGMSYTTAVEAFRGSNSVFLTVPADPETFTLVMLSSVPAFYHPAEESDLLKLIPSKPTIDLTLRLIFSRDAVMFATGSPSIKDYRMTHAAAFGTLLDDNADPIFIIQASIGTYDGGAVETKRFPSPGNAELALLPQFGPRATALLGGQLMIPAVPQGPLYGWRNYDHVGDADAPAQLNDAGQPFTTPASEVTDLHELARSLHEAPLDGFEAYFPTRILLDEGFFEAGVREGDLAGAMHPEGPTARPLIMLQAGDGFGTPDGAHQPDELVFPGYNHVDVATAAEKQNNGKPEPVSENLTRFVLETLQKQAGK